MLRDADGRVGDGLQQRVLDRWDELTGSQRRVASFVVDHSSEAVFLGVREVAARTDTSSATVVRFAQSIGYAGYPALLEALQEQLLDVVNPTSRLSATLEEIDEELDSEPSLLVHTVERDIATLRDTLGLVSGEEFVAAVDLLDRARVVYLAGFGLSAAPISTLAFRLRRLAIPVVEATTTGQDFYNTLLPMDADDVLVAVGFQPVPRMLLRAAAFAEGRGSGVIALTDTRSSPLQVHAQVALHAKRGPLTQLTSVVAPLGLANALAVALAGRRKDRAAAVYRDFEDLAGAGDVDPGEQGEGP